LVQLEQLAHLVAQLELRAHLAVRVQQGLGQAERQAQLVWSVQLAYLDRQDRQAQLEPQDWLAVMVPQEPQEPQEQLVVLAQRDRLVLRV
jgi:trans-aconitate methyltransferase